jgi:hypothetical protein
MELTKEEKQVITELLNRVQISPLDPNAIKSIELIQSILKKLSEENQQI